LDAVKDEFPRESYTIITKCGKYGSTVKDHVFDPETTKQSVERSLKRFHTDYLDVVCKSPHRYYHPRALTYGQTYTMSSTERMIPGTGQVASPSKLSTMRPNANNSTWIHPTHLSARVNNRF
jgi:hypothetical protein